jgi:hypothetical protein
MSNGSKGEKNSDVEKLARFEGEGWSDEVMQYIEDETNWAKSTLIKRAQESSSSRSMVQIGMISLACLALLLVTLKLQKVSKKLML